MVEPQRPEAEAQPGEARQLLEGTIGLQAVLGAFDDTRETGRISGRFLQLRLDDRLAAVPLDQAFDVSNARMRP